MLWSELEGKEIINVRDGDRMGLISEADLVIDESDGSITEIRMRRGGGFFDLFNLSSAEVSIPWEAVKKVGPRVVIVDMDVSRSPSGAWSSQ